MSFLPQVKCNRCDRTFSALRARCPYCGARRSKRSKKNINNDKVGWKLAVGIIIMVLLMAAVAVILVLSLTGENADSQAELTDALGITENAAEGEDAQAPDEEIQFSEGENVTSMESDKPAVKPAKVDEKEDEEAQPSEETEGEAKEESKKDKKDKKDSKKDAAVNKITITYVGSPVEDVTMGIGEVLQLECETDPADAKGDAKWSIDDESVATVKDGEVTAVASGDATLTVKIGDVSAECVVRVG